jgi:hypothetical protein
MMHANNEIEQYKTSRAWKNLPGKDGTSTRMQCKVLEKSQ